MPSLSRLAAEIRLCRQSGYYDLADDARTWLKTKGYTVKYDRDGEITIEGFVPV